MEEGDEVTDRIRIQDADPIEPHECKVLIAAHEASLIISGVMGEMDDDDPLLADMDRAMSLLGDLPNQYT